MNQGITISSINIIPWYGPINKDYYMESLNAKTNIRQFQSF